jgi:hypothetical protein
MHGPDISGHTEAYVVNGLTLLKGHCSGIH